jgi:two-component system, OmpR family, response regulator
MSGDGELDFTKPHPPSAPPPPEKVAEARMEASSGVPQLAKSGFYVAMARYKAGGPVPPNNGKRHAVLVIEDDQALLKLVAEVLGTAGFQVRTARNRAEVNGEINKAPLPDLILLDVTLPDADGFQILERVRAHPKLAKMPVVLMTAKSEVADVARGLALAADGYVTKPFKITALLSAVGTVLGLD